MVQPLTGGTATDWWSYGVLIVREYSWFPTSGKFGENQEKFSFKSGNLTKNFKSPGCGEQRSIFDFEIVQMLAYCHLQARRGQYWTFLVQPGAELLISQDWTWKM